MKERRRIIVVLGAHRSGTSAIVKCLEVMGVSLGSHLMSKNQFNEKGYWEDLDFLELNKEMMASMGREWHQVSSPDEGENMRLHANYSERASQLLRRKISSEMPYGVKDPRFCLLLPFWVKVFRECDVNVSYVIALRSPLSVVQSLENRNQLPPQKSYWIWIMHVLGALRDSVGSPRILVDYNELLRDSKPQCRRLADTLQLEINEDRWEQYQSTFLDSSLDHSEDQNFSQNDDSSCAALAFQIYDMLHQIALERESFSGERFERCFKYWMEILSLAGGLLQVSRSNEAVSREQVALTLRLNELEKLAERRREIVEELRAGIVAQKSDIESLRKTEQSLREAVQMAEETINGYQATLGTLEESLESVEAWQRSWFRRAFTRWHRFPKQS